MNPWDLTNLQTPGPEWIIGMAVLFVPAALVLGVVVGAVWRLLTDRSAR